MLSAPAFATAADTHGGGGRGLRVVSSFAHVLSSRLQPHFSPSPPLQDKYSGEKTGQWSSLFGTPGPSLLESALIPCRLRVAGGWLAAQWAQWMEALLPQPAAWLCDCVRMFSGLRPHGRRLPLAPRVAANPARPPEPRLVDSWSLLLGMVDAGGAVQLASARLVSHKWPHFKINKRRGRRSLDHLCVFLGV